jgi:membrane-associated protease RseP (regulator of RpoE activity)
MLIAIATMLFGLFVAWALIVTLLLLHEYGHIYAMRKMGIKVDKVVMGMFKLFSIKANGMTFEIGLVPVVAYCVSKDYERSDTNRRAWIALAGPAATLLTGVLFLVAYMATDYWLLKFAVQGSFILFITNVIPLPPLDGWVVAEHFMAKRGVLLSKNQRKHLFVVGMVTMVLVALVV